MPCYETVDINSIENEEARTIGAEHVVYHTIKELELDQKLLAQGLGKSEVETAIGVMAAKLIDPSSERATHLWLKNISGIDELMDTDFDALSQQRVYKVSDMLLKYKQRIEEHLSFKERNLFNLQEKIILYDLTNTFFEGSGKYNSNARFGRSKEKRTDCPLVTLGLVLDSDGFPKRSKVFAGNVSEPKTFKEMIKNLSPCEQPLFKPTIVMDAGIATEDNIKWLNEKKDQYTYLVVSRKKKEDIPEGIEMVTVRKDKQTIVKAGLTENKETDEIELYCHSTGKGKEEKAIKNSFSQRFEEELIMAGAALSKKNTTKRYEKVIERIGRLKERFKRIAHRYEITVTKDVQTNKAKDINWHQKKGEDKDGLYCLRTNIKNFEEQEIWDIYNMLTDIEDAFCCMKSELGLRPVHHQKESRVDGHLFITVLGYHILHAIRFKLRQKGIYYDWRTIRKSLSTHVRITTTMKRKDGKLIHTRKFYRAEMGHKEIYDALGLPHQAGKTIRSIL
jgi:transposase